MTQNSSDVEIANQGFAAFRQDLNDVLEDITTLHSGDTAPTTTYANQFWYETDTDKLYIRNEDNDDWIEILTLDQANDHLATIGASITLDGTGNVGIGATPSVPLEVNVSGAGDVFKLTRDTGTNGELSIDFNGASANFNSEQGGFTFETSAAANAMTIGSSGNVGVGTDSPSSDISGSATVLQINDNNLAGIALNNTGANTKFEIASAAADALIFTDNGSERMRIDSSGNVLVGKTSSSFSTSGIELKSNSNVSITRNATCVDMNRLSDGTLVNFYSQGTVEGGIAVSGTTVSYIGGHLSRWSQLADGTKDTSIVKGTVMTNLDQMAIWSHDAAEAVEAQDAVYDDDGNVVTEAVEAVEAKDAYTEDNEQLNCLAVSSVEGDPNVAGVLVSWDNDDDAFNDMNIAMTGDMVIRIAQGTTVARGELLMSAGDGTAKPQGDDIVRSKTIAKVISTNVSHTYDDGSYLVPCVLMAC